MIGVLYIADLGARQVAAWWRRWRLRRVATANAEMERQLMLTWTRIDASVDAEARDP